MGKGRRGGNAGGPLATHCRDEALGMFLHLGETRVRKAKPDLALPPLVAALYHGLETHLAGRHATGAKRKQLNLPYSYRSASIGSSRLARRAG